MFTYIMTSNKYLTRLFLILFLVVNWSCGSDSSDNHQAPDYVSEIKEWRDQRLKNLKKKDGWLSLAGLYWLDEGKNSCGSDSSNDIVFPRGKAPAYLGTFILKDTVVSIQIAPAVSVLYQGKPVPYMKLLGDGVAKHVVLSHGSLSWNIIERGDKIGVRLRDSENPAIDQLKKIESFAIDSSWRLAAQWKPYDPPKNISFQNVLGMNLSEASPGLLEFEIEGRTFQLETLDSEDELFVIFSDETSGEETYGSCRYLYVKKPAEGAKAYIDFNKAYNPPCAYTNFATCPLPPPQNHLPIKITAGEKFANSTH